MALARGPNVPPTAKDGTSISSRAAGSGDVVVLLLALDDVGTVVALPSKLSAVVL